MKAATLLKEFAKQSVTLNELVVSLFFMEPRGPSLCDLPEDICHTIIGHLMTRKPLYTYFQQRDIVSLSSTSKAFRALCLPYIFKDLRIRFLVAGLENGLECGHPGSDLSSDRTQRHRSHVYRSTRRPLTGAPSLEALLLFLDDCPYVAPLIRLLALECDTECCLPLDANGSPTRHAVDPGLLLSVLNKLPNLQALQLVDVRLASTTDSDIVGLQGPGPGRVSVEHLRISFSKLVSRTHHVEIREAFDALHLFRDVGALHLGPFPTSERDAWLNFPATIDIRTIFLRNPWPVRETVEALSASFCVCLTSLDIGDSWTTVQEEEVHRGWEGSGEGDTVDAQTVALLRKLLHTSGGQLTHLGLGAMTLSHSSLLSGSSVERVLQDCILAWCPNLESLAINVSLSDRRPGRTEGMLQTTTCLLEALRPGPCQWRLAPLRAMTLNFELSSLPSIHGDSEHSYFMYSLDAYRPLFRRMDNALASLAGVLNVFFEASESEPCGLDIGVMEDVYFAHVLPEAWLKMKRVPVNSPWAINRRLSLV